MSKTSSLLISRVKPTSLQHRPQNPINGSDAESYAMSQIILACRGEGYWGSREEDNSKIDMIFSLDHPWRKNERLVILSQVKSGTSYGEQLKTGFKLTKDAKNSAIRTTHAICLIWVNRDASKCYWAYIHPTSTTKAQEYGSYHEITPATVYDLARCAGFKRPGVTGGRGIIIRHRSSNLTTRRKNVLKLYRQQKSILNPSMGEIELTRLGWRHMLRAGRRRQNKQASLDTIPYLRSILTQSASSHAITAHKSFQFDGSTYRLCEHLMKYDQVKMQDAKLKTYEHVTVYIRVIEEIRYPTDWKNLAMLSQQVERRVVLKSAYFKK